MTSPRGHAVSAAIPVGLDLTEAVRDVWRLKFGGPGPLGWSPRLRERFGYFTPDEFYEAILLRLIDGTTDWLDVGCGRAPFPSNAALGRLLASRCRRLVGLDPSDNIDDNSVVHERAKCPLEEYRPDRQFGVISLRMVAEHIGDPPSAVAALARLCRPGGRVVVYTVSKWSPASMVASVTPMAVHHLAKRIIWGTLPADTFPTTYRMNTRRKLQRLFANAGLAEEAFLYLDDCRALARWRPTAMLELSLQRALRTVGIRYPEVCLLGVYRQPEGASPTRNPER